MFFESYKLDNYLSATWFKEHVGKSNIVNNYPLLEKTLTKIRNMLEEYEFSPTFITHGQIYTTEIKLFGGDFYKMAWDIGYAEAVIKQLNIPIQTLSVDYLIRGVDKNTIEHKYLEKAKRNNEPIIVVSYPQLQSDPCHIIIDGNHRIFSRYKEGIKGIKGYILEPDQHYNAMASGIHRLLYIVHDLIYTMSEYLQGRVDQDELEFYISNLDKFKELEDQRISNMFR